MKANLLFLCCFVLFVSIATSVMGDEPASPSPLGLADCVALALEKSPSVALSKADVEARKSGLAGARKDLFPIFSLEYDYLHRPDYPLAYPSDSFSYTLSVTQPIYRGNTLITAVELQKLALEYSQSVLAMTRQDIVRGVTDAYFSLLRAEKFELEAKQALSRLESHRKDAQAFFDAGLIPKNDLLMSELQLAQGRQDLIRAQNNTALARATVNVFLRQPADASLSIIDILTFDPLERRWEEALQQAMHNRPEVAQKLIEVEKAEKNVVLAKSSYFPSVNLSAAYMKQGDDPWPYSYPYGPTEVKTVQATAQWQLWAWGQTNDKVAEARQNHRKAQESFAQLQDSITLEAREAFLNVREAQENIVVTQMAIEQAEENYRISVARYQAQLATSTEVLDAQTLLTQARTNYYNSLYGFNIALVRLDRACGLLDKDRI